MSESNSHHGTVDTTIASGEIDDPWEVDEEYTVYDRLPLDESQVPHDESQEGYLADCASLFSTALDGEGNEEEEDGFYLEGEDFPPPTPSTKRSTWSDLGPRMKFFLAGVMTEYLFGKEIRQLSSELRSLLTKKAVVQMAKYFGVEHEESLNHERKLAELGHGWVTQAITRAALHPAEEDHRRMKSDAGSSPSLGHRLTSWWSGFTGGSSHNT